MTNSEDTKATFDLKRVQPVITCHLNSRREGKRLKFLNVILK